MPGLDAPKSTHILDRTAWRPPTAKSGKGIYLELENGQTVIDAVGGAAVACLGNGHPKVVQAVKDQVEKLSYVYNMQLSNEPAEALAKFLIDNSNGAFDKVGFVSGGSEAMEAAVKLARQYFHETGQKKRTNFIARHLSFHGNTMTTLSLASNVGRRAPYEDILDHKNFHHVSPAYAARFKKADETEEQYVQRLAQELEDKFQELGPDTVIAFVAETVVGATTGAVPPPKGYFKAMKAICRKHGALFILDEVMSGMGRTGTLHAWEQFADGESPDIEAIAKGLGAGYASIGGILMSEQISSAIYAAGKGFWKHGHTYQANPLACAASLAVQKTIQEENLLENCRKQGAYLYEQLDKRLRGPNAMAAPIVFDIRGGGLWYGVEFEFEGADKPQYDFKGGQFAMMLQALVLEKGLVIMGFTGGANYEGTKGNHILLSPAYNVTKEEIDKILDILVAGVDELLTKYNV